MRHAPIQELRDDPGDGSTWSNAAKLSRKIRELALRSHDALKASSQPEPQAQAAQTDIDDDLRDLRYQVARLQQKIHTRQLGPLIPWVDALRKQVEDHLGDARKAGLR